MTGSKSALTAPPLLGRLRRRFAPRWAAPAARQTAAAPPFFSLSIYRKNALYWSKTLHLLVQVRTPDQWIECHHHPDAERYLRTAEGHNWRRCRPAGRTVVVGRLVSNRALIDGDHPKFTFRQKRGPEKQEKSFNDNERGSCFQPHRAAPSRMAAAVSARLVCLLLALSSGATALTVGRLRPTWWS